MTLKKTLIFIVFTLFFISTVALSADFKFGDFFGLGNGDKKIEVCHKTCDFMYGYCMENMPKDTPVPVDKVCSELKTRCHQRCGGK